MIELAVGCFGFGFLASSLLLIVNNSADFVSKIPSLSSSSFTNEHYMIQVVVVLHEETHTHTHTN